VFCWREIDVPNVYARFARVTADSERTVIGEIAFRGAGGALIPGNTPEDPALTDEADRVPIAADWRNGTYFDEIYHPRSAYEYLNGITPIYEWTHPPLGKLIMAAGIKMFGMTPFGWRFMGILFGVLMTPLMYWFAKLVLRETPWAAAAAFIFSFDFMHYSQTRLATIDTYVVFFIIGMFAFMYRYYTMSFYDVPLKKTFVPLGLAGLCFGLGVSCKWPGLYAGAGLAALFLVTLAKRYMEYKRAKRKGFWEKTGKTVLFCLAAFVAVPAVIYTASFIPLCAPDNPGLAAFLKAVWSQQESMWTYHSQTVLNAEHGFSSSWWEWVLDLRPIWYYSRDLGGGIKEGISSFNNPAAALGGLAAMCYGLKASLKKNDRTWNFIIAGYLAQLLPWVFVPRLTFAYHYFPALPFLALAVGYALKNAPLKPGRKKAAALVMACAAAVMFAVYYPVLTGTPVSEAYVLKFLKLPLIGARWQLI
jgi:dolichyl-phosphate-mannose--protein O-mannosyl transferase